MTWLTYFIGLDLTVTNGKLQVDTVFTNKVSDFSCKSLKFHNLVLTWELYWGTEVLSRHYSMWSHIPSLRIFQTLSHDRSIELMIKKRINFIYHNVLLKDVFIFTQSEERQGRRASVHLFTPQMTSKIRAELFRSQGPRASSEFPVHRGPRT